jgi:serine/threonine protein kinase
VLARNFPGCDTDRVGRFMRDIFARDHKFETQDYASYVREDFSRVRERGQGQATMSVSDALEFPRRSRRPTSESRMSDSQASLLSGSNTKESSTREQAEQRWGTVVADRYRVEDLLTFDGSGALYRARDTERGMPCALRVLPEIYARDPEVHSRFERDAKAAQELMHPNISQVFDIGRLEDGSVYAVTELLNDGQSLATIIQEEGKLSPGRAVHVASQVCRALGTAHEAGIIHRDFKPGNVVLVAQEGDLDFVKVVDFGIVSHVDSEPTTTASQQELIVGSPDYMAPEQAAGTEASPASDIYALGVVLYEMLTGQQPYKGRNAIDVLIQKGGARRGPRDRHPAGCPRGARRHRGLVPRAHAGGPPDLDAHARGGPAARARHGGAAAGPQRRGGGAGQQAPDPAGDARPVGALGRRRHPTATRERELVDARASRRERLARQADQQRERQRPPRRRAVRAAGGPRRRSSAARRPG